MAIQRLVPPGWPRPFEARHDELMSYYDLLSQAGRGGLPMAKLFESGRYKSRSEALRRLSALDASLERGLADAEAGRVKLAADVFDRLEDKYRRLANRFA